METKHICFRHIFLGLFIKNVTMAKITFLTSQMRNITSISTRNASPNAFSKHSNPSLIKTNGISHFFKIDIQRFAVPTGYRHFEIPQLCIHVLEFRPLFFFADGGNIINTFIILKFQDLAFEP